MRLLLALAAAALWIAPAPGRAEGPRGDTMNRKSIQAYICAAAGAVLLCISGANASGGSWQLMQSGTTQNLNGSIGSSASEGSYVITADGRLTLTVIAVEPQLELGVSTKGQSAAGACVTSGVYPIFVVAVRQ